MARIRGSDTKPEVQVRSILHRMGYRFRLHRKDLPGSPDITLPKYKTVIFVNGCFWHRHTNCKFAYTPKSRTEFWNKKFEDNVARDHRVNMELKRMGWQVVTVWECQIQQPEKVADKLNKLLSSEQD